MMRAALLAAVLLAAGAGALAAAPVVEEAPKAGYRAPRFKALDLQGKPLGLRELQGRVVLLNFWASWCAPCVEEMPALRRLQAAMPATGFTVVALAQDLESGDVAKFLKDHPVNFPVALDEDNEIARLYKVRGLPVTFLIDKRGHIVEKIMGPKDWDKPEWADKIGALVKATGK